MWSGRCFGVVLHREGIHVEASESLDDVVIEAKVTYLDATKNQPAIR